METERGPAQRRIAGALDRPLGRTVDRDRPQSGGTGALPRRRMLGWLTALCLGWLSVDLRADERSFTLAGENIPLQDVSADVEVSYQAMRFNRAAGVWNVEVFFTNKGNRALQGPFAFYVTGFGNTSGPQQSDGTQEGQPFFDLSAQVTDGTLSPGEVSLPRTLTLGRTAGSPTLQAKIYGRAPPVEFLAAALTRTLNHVGQPLPGVEVTESGPSGERTYQSDPSFALVTLGQRSGEHTWKFSKAGHLPVWRRETLTDNNVALVPSPRLTPRDAKGVNLTLIGGGQLTDAAEQIKITFTPGAVTQATEGTLTALTPQTLPSLLPVGWSPLAAFWLELATEQAQPVSAQLTPPASVSGSESVALVRWNSAAFQWEVLQVVSGNGVNPVTVSVPGSGAFALVVGDTQPAGPPAPQIGQALQASTASLPSPDDLRATGRVNPPTSPASTQPEIVTATAEVTITGQSGPLPSGVPLRCEVSEGYAMQDGTRRVTPRYETFVTAYQRPSYAPGPTLGTSFPLRPLFLLGSDELQEATIKVDVLAPTAFTGQVFETSGGQIVGDGVRILAGEGDLARRQAVVLRVLSPASFEGLPVGGNTIVHAFELGVSEVAEGRRLTAQFGAQQASRSFALARIVANNGLYGVEPVERFASDAAGNLAPAEPSAGERLPGITGAGQFLLLRVAAPQGLVTGIARDSKGQAATNLAVRLAQWLTFSAADGRYRLLAPVGSAEVTVTDLTTGDSGQATAQVTDLQAPAQADPSATAAGPRVVFVSPENAAKNVARVAPITITFSEPINPGTVITGGIQLLGKDNQPVPASLTLNLKNTIATLLPTTQLGPSTLHTIQLSANIADATGLKLEGPAAFTFITVSDTLARGAGSVLTIFEPGAKNIPPDVLREVPGYDPARDIDIVVAHGSQGTADPEVAVILVNETTSETATVLSKPDGSFSNFIRAAEDDFITAVFVNANGSRVTVPATKQRFDDGRVGLYQQGGILEAESDGGPVQVLVEPGAVNTRTRFKMDVVPLQQVLQALEGVQPAGGKVLGGIAYHEELDPITATADVSFPIAVADLDLPAGADPAQASFGLTVPTEIDGLKVFQLIDTMSFQPEGDGKGRLVTQSPPFVGLLLRQIEQMRQNTGTPNIIGRFTRDPFDLAFGQFGFQPVLNVMLVPIFMAPGPPAKVAGKVLVVPADAVSIVATETTPVAGAFVRLRLAQVASNPFAAGDVFAISERDGRYAIATGTGLESGAGFAAGLVIGTHPAFPFQEAKVPFTTALVTKADLYFKKKTGPITGVTDNVAPLIRVTQTPRLGTAGVGANDGAVLSVTALDDFQVANVQVLKQDFRTLAGDAPLDPSLLKAAEFIDAAPSDGARVLRRYRVRASQPGRAVYKITATDAAGNTAAAPYALTFRSGPGPDADLPNRVLFAWPPDKAKNIPAGTPIVLRFTTPLTPEQLADTSWLTLQPPGAYQVTRVEPSADRREITVFYANGAASVSTTTFELTIPTDVATAFETDGVTFGAFKYKIEFSPTVQSVPVTAGSGAALTGRGAVLVGDFVYMVGIRGEKGVVQQFRFTGLNFPEAGGNADAKLEFVSEITFPGRPSELVHIPNYPLRRRDGLVLAPVNYLAVFDGAANDTKTVRIFRIAPQTGAIEDFPGPNGVITTEPAQIVKARWDPPFIAFFELGADVTSVKLLNFNALFVGLEARAAGLPLRIFPDGGKAGVDLNEDGDFADENEQAPLPDGEGVGGLGVEFSFAPANRNDRLIDFDFNADFALLATAVRGINGRPNALVMRLGGGTGVLDEETARVTFPEEPKRVLLLTRQRLLAPQPNGGLAETEADLALVSTANSVGAAATADGVLIVVDVSKPAVPSILGRAKLPAGAGSLNTIVRRDDGLLALASSGGGLILLDPRLLLQPNGTNAATSFTAAVQTTAAGLGSPVRTFVADDSGYHVTGNGSQPAVAFTDPDIRVVTFPGIAPFDPRPLADPAAPRPPGVGPGEEGLENLIFSGRAATSPKIAQLATDAGTADPDSHLYVIVRAPGIAGPELQLATAALNSRGLPLLQNLDVAVPTFLGEETITVRFALMTALEVLKNASFNSTSLSGLLQGLATGSVKVFLKSLYEKAFAEKPAYPNDLKARRLSDNPASPLFNTYLAGPIVLLKEDLTKERFTELDNADGANGQLRRYLRASTYFWVGLGVSLDDAPLLGNFASQQEEDFDAELDASFSNVLGLGFAAVEAFFTSNPLALVPAIAKFIDLHLTTTIQPGLNALVHVGCIRHPLVVIPGVMGSKLRGSPTLRLWLNPLNSLFQSNLEQLVLAADGTSQTVEPFEIFDRLPDLGAPGPELADSGARLIEHLVSQHAYRLYELRKDDEPIGEAALRLDGSPHVESLAKLPDLFPFPYDWRQDNAETAKRLKKYFDLIRAYHPDGDKVDIIAHSMGGLVSRRFILDNPGAVDRLITIASPLLGATKAVAAKRLGDFDDLALNIAVPQPVMKKISRHNPALDQLMPSKALFDLGLRPVSESGWDADDDCLPYETYEYVEYKKVLDGFLYHARAGDFPPPPNLYPDPRPIGGPNNNEAFHSFGPAGNNQDDWRGDNSGTRYTHIVALQRNRSTISRVRLTPSLRELAPDEGADVGLGFPPLNFADTEDGTRDIPVAAADDPQFPSALDTAELSLSLVLDRGPGDSTVPFLSQTRAFGSSRSLNAPGTLMIPVLSTNATGASDKATSHVGVLSDKRCLDWISRVLRDKVTSQTMATVSISVGGATTEGGTITFSATAGNVPSGTFASGDFIWDTGDSDMFIGQSGGTHTYAEDGVYTLTCAVATADGKFAGISSVAVTIANGAPTIAFDNPPAEAQVGEPFTLRTTVSDPGLRDPHKFTWDFGDGSDASGVPPDAFAVRHFFKAPGTYTVTVKVEDDDGASATATHSMQVESAPVAPAASFARRALAPQGPPPPPDAALIAVDEVAVLVRGHTAEAGDVAIFHDGEPLFDITGNLVRFVKGLLLPGGQNTEQIVVRREPEAAGGDLPANTTIRVKAFGKEVTLDALVLLTSGQTHCFHWLLSTSKDDPVRLEVPWAQVATLQNDGLPALTSPSAVFANRVNCLDLRGTSQNVVRDELTQELQAFRFDETVVDGEPTTPDADPTEIDTEADATEPPPRTDTLVTQVDPMDPCMQSENLLAVSLLKGQIPITAASGTPHLVAVRDKRGNVTVTSNIHRPLCDDVATPGDFDNVREGIMAIFRDGVATATAKDFLLSIDDLWILEQGSGAALWKGDDVRTARIYKPGQSDNDYELFFPLWKTQQWDPADPSQSTEFLRLAHDRSFMEGDWYFKPPVGLVVDDNSQIQQVLGFPPDPEGVAALEVFMNTATHWSYRPPGGLLTLSGVNEVRVPASGPFFKFPQVPAAILAGKVLRDQARSTPERRRMFKDITFFPFRREHFLFAVPSLEKPPPFGDDPIGDAGMGRGFLFLKWVLEGAFLPPFSSGAGGANFNATVQPDGVSVRNEVFDRLNTRRAELTIESYEWGVYQEFAALAGNVLLRMQPENAAANEARNTCRRIFGDFLAQHDAVALRKAGKSALRGVLAFLAQDDQAFEEMFDLDPSEFDANGVLSFEHQITAVAAGYLDDLGLSASDLGDFLGAKIGDCEVLKGILDRPNGADAFILKVFDFLRGIQQDTAAEFLSSLESRENEGRIDEAFRRKLNAHAIDFGFGRPDGAFESGRLAMHGEDPDRSHQSKFTFFVNLFNPTGMAVSGLGLTLDSAISYPDPIAFSQGQVTLRLWGEDSAGQPKPNPYVVKRNPANTATVRHAFVLSGLAPAQNKVAFNDASNFESRFLDPPVFTDDALEVADDTVWLYRGLTGNNANFPLIIQQLDAGHMLAPFHLQDGDADEESEAEVETEIAIELALIQSRIDDPAAAVNPEFDDADVNEMPDDGKLAVFHVPAARPICLSTADSMKAALLFTTGAQIPLLVAFELEDPGQNRVKYVPLRRTDSQGNRVAVRLNRQESEHVFISKLRFKRAILFEVSEVPLANGKTGYALNNIGEFTGQP